MVDERLLDNIIIHDQEFFLKNMSPTTKEMVLKDGVLKRLKGLLHDLNKEFKDVRFKYSVLNPIHSPYENGCFVKFVYGKDEEIDEEEFSGDDEAFYETDLQEMTLKIDYLWDRVCSLGCLHTFKKFHIFNFAKLLDILTYWSLGKPVRALVKEHIPDFFYDPTEPPPGVAAA
jgi:hypothetical protein